MEKLIVSDNIKYYIVSCFSYVMDKLIVSDNIKYYVVSCFSYVMENHIHFIVCWGNSVCMTFVINYMYLFCY